MRTKVVDDPERITPVHERPQEVVDRVEGRAVTIQALERFDFYAAATRAFAVVRTSDPGPRTLDAEVRGLKSDVYFHCVL